MRPVAVYRRTIRASVPRIWENVLDWEHLPWLHASSFVAVELVCEDRDGWRAWISVPPADDPRRSLVDVRLERSDACYWTRTVEGFGTGTGIRTALAPHDDHATDITVEFFVPGVTPAAAPLIGRAYEKVYARLWDEDEAMMMRRQAVLDATASASIARATLSASTARAPLVLGPLAALRTRLPLVVGRGPDAVRVVEVGGELVAHAVACPHLGGPLDAAAPCDGVLTCPWHGYRFDLQSGASADGRGLRLPPAPRVHVDADGVTSLVFG